MLFHFGKPPPFVCACSLSGTLVLPHTDWLPCRPIFNMNYSGRLFFGVFQCMHREKDFDGTGLGLGTVQRILQKHGERIWAKAQPEKGATFISTAARPRPERIGRQQRRRR